MLYNIIYIDEGGIGLNLSEFINKVHGGIVPYVIHLNRHGIGLDLDQFFSKIDSGLVPLGPSYERDTYKDNGLYMKSVKVTIISHKRNKISSILHTRVYVLPKDIKDTYKYEDNVISAESYVVYYQEPKKDVYKYENSTLHPMLLLCEVGREKIEGGVIRNSYNLSEELKVLSKSLRYIKKIISLTKKELKEITEGAGRCRRKRNEKDREREECLKNKTFMNKIIRNEKDLNRSSGGRKIKSIKVGSKHQYHTLSKNFFF